MSSKELVGNLRAVREKHRDLVEERQTVCNSVRYAELTYPNGVIDQSYEEVQRVRDHLSRALSSIDPGAVLVMHDVDEDMEIVDQGLRGGFMDRSGSMEPHMIIQLGEEVERIRDIAIKEAFVPDDYNAPLGKSPDKIRKGQKDWQVSSGRGLRR